MTASRDKTARLWDVASGKALHVLRGHEDWVRGAQFSADGRTVVTASGDKTVRLWQCGACRAVDDAMVQALSRWVGRSLTEEERQRFGLNDASPRGR